MTFGINNKKLVSERAAGTSLNDALFAKCRQFSTGFVHLNVLELSKSFFQIKLEIAIPMAQVDFPELNRSRSITHLEALQNYVVQTNSYVRHPHTRTLISQLLDQQPPLHNEIVMYRGIDANYPGQNTSPLFAFFQNDFFSVSDSGIIAMQFTNPDGCCFIEIHIQPGIRILDVHSYLDLPGYVHEQEWLVQGGGQFYADSGGTRPGFTHNTNTNTFVTYYFPSRKNEIRGGKRRHRTTRKCRISA